jgi:hypothetical protein
MRKFPDNLQPKIPYTINYGGLINRLEHIAAQLQRVERVGELLRSLFRRQTHADVQGRQRPKFCFVNISGAAAIQLIVPFRVRHQPLRLCRR